MDLVEYDMRAGPLADTKATFGVTAKWRNAINTLSDGPWPWNRLPVKLQLPVVW
jgi:hypothetical protein